MGPEEELALFASRIHLSDSDVDYLLGLLQQARGLGSAAGAAAEREACAEVAETHTTTGACGLKLTPTQGEIARAIRARGQP